MNFIKPLVGALLAAMTALAFAAVDVNKASQAELESIKGIGPSMSTRIVDARKTGQFKDWSDLQSRVKGVRDKTSSKFSTQGLTVNGQAYAGGGDASAPKAGAKGTKPTRSDSAKNDSSRK